jgi:serine/threonine protein kinase
VLSKSRILLQGHSEYSWEADGLKFIRENLPDSHPFYVWELVELVDAARGRIYEIDCLVLGYRALYLVELKGGPGTYEGDSTDWYRTEPGERPHYMDPPYKLTNLKAKVLKSLLERHLPKGSVPWVQPLVFLSDKNVTLKLRPPGDQCVVTQHTFLGAVKLHNLPGVDVAYAPNPISQPQAKLIVEALKKVGFRESEGARRVGSYKLGPVLEEGPGYEDREAEHAERSGIRRRARIYLVPQQTSVDRRQTLLRAADREASLLEELKEFPGILRISDYVTGSLVGPTVLFDYFDGIPLDAFMRRHPDLPFDKRVEIIEKVGLVLAYCHSKQILHGALSPSAVLVHQASDGALDIRVYNFQLGGAAGGTSTVHWTSLSALGWSAYQAPELRENPSARSPASDMFSLGALAYFVLTGREPGASGVDIDRILTAAHGPGHLDPRAVSEEIPPRVAEAICIATELKPINRGDDVNEWLQDWFLEAATAPPTVELVLDIDPLQAKRPDLIGGDLEVERVLGQGASAKVLQVKHSDDDRSYALKISLSSDDNQRLEAEANVLKRLRHSGIVQFADRREIAGRTCIRMELAGDTTLSRKLTQDGALSLDYAARYGEDLLLAMQYLEEQEVLHRDIKPGNLGVGTAVRGAYHLMLFDFSLAFDYKATDAPAQSLSHVEVGTAAYRDPFLRLRGAWDFAADRWSAAVTLHEMLTGTRPTFEPEGTLAIAPDSKLVLAAERFDAAVRDQLVAFFQQALHRESSARFESAQAMRKAWNQAFELSKRPTEQAVATSKPGRESWTEAELSAIGPDAPIASLPLSSLALNALDRAGLTVASDLLQLPDNRLSAIRGVGTNVAKQILRFRDVWRPFTDGSRSEVDCFLPGFEGKDLAISELGLSSAFKRTLLNAGFTGLMGLATAPSRQIESLASRAKQSLPELRQLLTSVQNQSVDSEHPTTVADWVESLLPKQKKRRQHLEVLFGLAAPLLGNFEAPMATAAEALEMTRGGLSVVVTSAQPEWAQHPGISELQLLLHSLVNQTNPVVRVRELALAILGRFNEAGDVSPLKLAQAAALARIVTAVEREQPGGLRWVRVADCPWVVVSDDCAPILRDLGHAADQLAQRQVLASPGEVARLLRSKIEKGTAFETVTDEQLTAWAAQASQIAARSSRLEIYPKKLPASRALELSSPVLTGSLTPDRVLTLVSTRYPEADPLPQRPELDALLLPFGLKWSPIEQVYARPGDNSRSLHSVSYTVLPTSLGTLTSSQREINPEVVEIRDFEDKMRSALQEHKLRVLCVSKSFAARTALSLRDVFGLTLVDLDKLLTQQLFGYMKADGIEEANVFNTDRVGEDSEEWSELKGVVTKVANGVATKLFPVTQPTLLVQPGLIARFELKQFVLRMVEAAQSRQTAACFLLVPGPEQFDVPRINGHFSLSGLSPADAVWVPHTWISNRKPAA